jgi:hypothetical protein
MFPGGVILLELKVMSDDTGIWCLAEVYRMRCSIKELKEFLKDPRSEAASHLNSLRVEDLTKLERN